MANIYDTKAQQSSHYFGTSDSRENIYKISIIMFAMIEQGVGDSDWEKQACPS